MSRRRPKRSDERDEPVLFDLPLDPPEPSKAARPAPRPEPEEEGPAEAAERGMLSLFDDEEIAEEAAPGARPRPPSEPRRSAVPRPAPAPEWEEEPAPGPRPAPDPEHDPGAWRAAGPARVTLASRFLAGLADLAIHAGVAVLLLLGARLLGVAAGYEDWPAVVLFLLVFSFLYSVLPLAFWGQTPGMAWAGLVARAPGGVGLTFGQTARRWLGSLITVALLGLPTLLAALGGRSLADAMSGSELSAT